MGFLLLAIGLVLFVEGLVYALAPSLLRTLLEMIRNIPDSVLRQNGVMAVVLGLVLIWGAFQLGF
jgi:uncharacterized protein YjeT (DUF2065 family)